MFAQAIKRGHGCVYVCVIIKQISSTQLLVCMCVCVCVCHEALLGVLEKKRPEMCVFVRMQDQE